MVTYEDFVRRYMGDLASMANSLRVGQVFFNTLYVCNPVLADKIRSSLLDPFHKDRVDEKTWSFVAENWS